MQPWLTLVGVGADGLPSLTDAAREALGRARWVFGSRRQLALVAPLLTGAAVPWPTPLGDGLALLEGKRGEPCCALASGDPFFYGLGATLARRLSPAEYTCLPAPSSLSLAAARLGWALQDVEVVSLHGRPLEALARYLLPGRRLLVLSWDGRTPDAVAALLCARGFAESAVHVLEDLGTPRERVRAAPARALSLGEVSDLNLLAIELACAAPQGLHLATGLDDDAFEHDGQLTKRDIRALTLSALQPRPGALLWDVGAGAGSVAIEWSLRHPSCRAVAFERDAARCARVERNARRFGTPELAVVQGEAPQALEGQPTPDAIFVGGGATQEVLERGWAALRAGGRMVLNAVTLEAQRLASDAFASLGGELRRFSVEVAEPLGRLHGFRPARAVVQWRASKPC